MVDSVNVNVDVQANEILANGVKRGAVSPPTVEVAPSNVVVPVVVNDGRVNNKLIKKRPRKKAT